jgi:hypothetical protein
MDHPSALVIVGLLSTLCVRVSAESPQETFARSWEGRPVKVRQALYSLIYNERGKLGTTRNGRRDGLTVLTPSNGVYFQFDGRQGRDDVVARAPEQIVDAVSDAYGPDTLEVRSYRRIEPLAVHQFSAGVDLVVGKVKIERDTVKVVFVEIGNDPDGEPVTSLTIKWPLPLSKSFGERVNIDALLRMYVVPKSDFSTALNR